MSSENTPTPPNRVTCEIKSVLLLLLLDSGVRGYVRPTYRSPSPSKRVPGFELVRFVLKDKIRVYMHMYTYRALMFIP